MAPSVTPPRFSLPPRMTVNSGKRPRGRRAREGADPPSARPAVSGRRERTAPFLTRGAAASKTTGVRANGGGEEKLRLVVPHLHPRQARLLHRGVSHDDGSGEGSARHCPPRARAPSPEVAPGTGGRTHLNPITSPSPKRFHHHSRQRSTEGTCHQSPVRAGARGTTGWEKGGANLLLPPKRGWKGRSHVLRTAHWTLCRRGRGSGWSRFPRSPQQTLPFPPLF